MIRKYYNHKLQANPWHREEEPQNNHEPLLIIDHSFVFKYSPCQSLKTMVQSNQVKLMVNQSSTMSKVSFVNNIYCKFGNFSEGFYFRETSHMRSFVKMKSSRNADINLSFTNIRKSWSICEFLASQICILKLLAKIKFSRKFPDLQ